MKVKMCLVLAMIIFVIYFLSSAYGMSPVSPSTVRGGQMDALVEQTAQSRTFAEQRAQQAARERA